jgi:hypothetical protein
MKNGYRSKTKIVKIKTTRQRYKQWKYRKLPPESGMAETG